VEHSRTPEVLHFFSFIHSRSFFSILLLLFSAVRVTSTYLNLILNVCVCVCVMEFKNSFYIIKHLNF